MSIDIEMTREEALKAFKDDFGGYDVAMFSMDDKSLVEFVEKALETGEWPKFDVEGAVY